MPYVSPQNRSDVDQMGVATNVGELTYLLMTVVLDYLNNAPAGCRYQDYAEVLGALTAVQLELYRRSVAPYEDRKAAESGDLPYPHRSDR